MQSSELQLQPLRANVAAARTFAVSWARAMGLGDCADLVELLVSETVTNAVVHARTPLRLRMTCNDGGVVRVEVTDGSTAALQARDCELEATTGRGMALMDAFADDWGTRLEPGGKTVWFTVRAP